MDFFKTPHIQIQLLGEDLVFKYEFLVLFIYPCVWTTFSSHVGRVLHIPDMKQFGMVGWWQGNREVAKGGWKVGQSFSKLYLPFNGPDKYIH